MNPLLTAHVKDPWHSVVSASLSPSMQALHAALRTHQRADGELATPKTGRTDSGRFYAHMAIRFAPFPGSERNPVPVCGPCTVKTDLKQSDHVDSSFIRLLPRFLKLALDSRLIRSDQSIETLGTFLGKSGQYTLILLEYRGVHHC